MRLDHSTIKKAVSEKEQAVKELVALLNPTMTIYTVLRHVSASGMTRHISAYVMVKDEYTGFWKPRNIDWYFEKILGLRRARNSDGLCVHGCGMDMGFSIVYNLSTDIFRQGFSCLGKNCQANDHANNPKCDRVKGKHLHKDGGYAIKQEWL